MDWKENTLLSVPQFAATLGVTPACIRRWLLERRINSVKIGSKLVRIPSTEVDRLIKSGYRPAKRPFRRPTRSRP